MKSVRNLQTPRHFREGLGTETVKAQKQKHADCGERVEANFTEGEHSRLGCSSGDRLQEEIRQLYED